MANKCRQAFETAAKRILQLPADYDSLLIKDNIPKQVDWDDLNTAVCEELGEVDCTIVESELDPFWTDNRTFGDLLKYVEQNCNC